MIARRLKAYTTVPMLNGPTSALPLISKPMENVPVHTGASEELTTNAKGESYASYADYAIAVVDEAESGKHVGERISVYAK